ncbi:ester cyclase [Nocardioides panacis]|uniref:Ester cyclase n=1 Tax=Nocardioides panacis TaxID=2849501 RepID=A0A975Y0R0_9ACTN|nr:ester cyclase [Nocardioides panacis]QWZ08720.1 ester cyclase [Nocardioides panacis]
MSFDVDAMMRLWSEPLPDSDEEAAAAFRALYTDPVVVNGAALGVADLVARARAVQRTFERRDDEVLEVVRDADRVAVAFRMSGRQVGPLATTLGPLPPSGEHVELRVIDILTLTDERVSTIWMVADELGTLVAADAVAWK